MIIFHKMKRAFFFLVVIFLINALGLYYGWYHNFFWFDITLHFLGGLFVAMLMANYLNEHLINKNTLKNILIIVGAAMFIGVTWEFTEYIANFVLSPIIYEEFATKTYFMGDLNDTVNDLTMDMLGAGTFAWLHPFRSSETH